MVYKIKDNHEEFCLVTTDKAKAEECVRRLNAISRYNNNTWYEIEEGEDDVSEWVMAEEKWAIEKAQNTIRWYSKDLTDKERELATLRKLKAKLDPIITNAKAPKDMVPEMIKAIHNINLDVCVVEFFNHHKLVMHYPDGTIKTETGENYCDSSFLRVNGTPYRYMNKWDIDDDIRHVESEIKDAVREINDAKKFLAEIEQKGE